MDDLLDLNWSSSGSSSAQQKAASSGSAFDSLARAGSPGVNYYGSSSSSSNAIQPTRAVSPSVKPSSPSSAKDAFSSLFDSTPNGTRGASQNTSSMTMQQRMDMQRSGSGASYAYFVLLVRPILIVYVLQGIFQSQCTESSTERSSRPMGL